MQPPSQPGGPAPGTYAPYGYAQPAGAGMPMQITKKLVFVAIGLGALMVWVAQLALRAFNVTGGSADFMEAIRYTGALFGFGGSLLGVLGTENRTDGWQKLGLAILAAVFAGLLA